MNTRYAGLNITKSKLQLHLAGRLYQLPNTPAGHRRLLRLLAAHPGVHVICEAAGGYERAVVASLHAHRVIVSVLDPASVREFAQAAGQRAQTDAVDAAVLTAYGQERQPQPSPPPTPKQVQLAEMIWWRDQLARELAIQRQQLQQFTLPFIRRQGENLLRRLEHQIEQLEAQIEELRAQE